MACAFHLVRHAEHTLPEGTLAGRLPGLGLSARGSTQAHALAGHLAQSRARAVVCSPLQRTRETATPIAAALGQEPIVEPALTEIDFGPWAGRSFDSLEMDLDWRRWNAARGLAATPAGETMLAVQARAVAALMSMAREGGAVIVVSHADVIKAILAYALGMPLDFIHRLHIDLASRSTLLLGPSMAHVLAMNLPVISPTG